MMILKLCWWHECLELAAWHVDVDPAWRTNAHGTYCDRHANGVRAGYEGTRSTVSFRPVVHVWFGESEEDFGFEGWD